MTQEDVSRPLARGRIVSLINGIKRDSLLRNSFHIMLTALGNSGLGYAYWVLAAHLLPPSAVGLGSALVSAMSICAIVAGLGLTSTFIERLPGRASGHDWNVSVTSGLTIGAVAGALCAIAALIVLPRFSASFDVLTASSLALVLFLAGTVCWTVSNLVDYVFVAERASGGMSTRNITFGALKLALLVLPVGTATAILPLFASWVVAAVFTLTVTMVVLVPRLRPGARPIFTGLSSEARHMLPSMLGHHATNLGGMLPMYILPVLVVVRLSPEDNAFFYLTWMLGNVFFMISPAVASSLFAEGSHDIVSFGQQVRRSGKIIALLLCGPAVLSIAIGHSILRIFGAQFPSHAYLLLVLLAISAVPDAITNIAISVLRVRRRLIAAAALNTGMAALTVGGAWLLLPHLGITGGGVAWLLAQTTGAILVSVALLRHRKDPSPVGGAR